MLLVFPPVAPFLARAAKAMGLARGISRRAAVGALTGLLWAGVCWPGITGAQGAAQTLAHTWSRVFYGKLNGEERLLFAGGMERLKPTLGDIDGDGDADLLLGMGDGRIIFFRNDGSAKKPLWRLVGENVLAQPDPEVAGSVAEKIDVGQNAAPALVDLDGDGDLDLVVGAASGQLHFFRNEGNRFLAVFQKVTPNLLGQTFGANAAPQFFDFTGDAIPDLVLGTAEGDVLLLVNQGTRFAPHFCPQATPAPPGCLIPPAKVARIEPQDNAVPFPVDWDGDGDLDLLVGKSDGKLAYFRNIGTSRRGRWELAQPRFLILDAGGYAAPVLHDLDGDGRPDLMLAGDGERVSLHLNRLGSGGAELWLEEDNLLRVERLGRHQSRLHLTSGDWDGDGDPDLVIGTRGGRLLLYENLGEKGVLSLRSQRLPLLPTPQRSFSAPALADIDGDGDLDLLVGDRNGRLEWIRNAGTPKKPVWQVAALHFQNIDVGAFSTPVLADLNGKGTLELLVGNSLGNVVHFANRGTPQTPVFVAAAINFGGFRVSGEASPAFFSYDPKGPAELVVGSASGRLRAATRDPSAAVSEGSAYRPQPQPWAGIATQRNSAPHFVDIDGDGRPDLLLGGNDGTLAAWRYEGSAPRPQVAARTGPSNTIPQDGMLRAPGGATGGGLGSEPGAGMPEMASPGGLEPIFVPAGTLPEGLRLGRHSHPAFFDPGRGRLELVVGTAEGKLLHFRNDGPPEHPRWTAVGGNFAAYNHGRNAAPVFFDVDGDGDQDLAVGNEQGLVNYWENTGGPGKPGFTLRPVATTAVRAGKNAVPAFGDVDGDGVTDLVVGNLRGGLLFYRRSPGREVAFRLVERGFLELDVGVNASPTLAPLAGRKEPVLLVGSDRGPIAVAVPEGQGRNRWRLNKTFLEGLAMPPGSAPALGDLDGDGDLDLYVGSEGGHIYFFRNNALVRPARPGAPRSGR